MPPRRSRNSVKTEAPETVEEDSKENITPNESKKDQSQWILLTPDGILDPDPNDENTPVFVSLRHPKTEQDALFLFTHRDTKIFEVQKFSEKYRSWLVEETVQEDGGYLCVTPYDPIYLVLPYLIKAAQVLAISTTSNLERLIGQGYHTLIQRHFDTCIQTGKFMTLDQIVIDENYLECHRLLVCSGVDDMSYVADIKGDEDLKVYRYNKDKTLSWLKLKVDRLVQRLREKCVSVANGGQSANYVRSLKEDPASIDEYRRYACGMISDYLPLDLSSSLLEYLDIPVPDEASPVVEPPNKKVKLEPSDLSPTEDYSKGGKKLEAKSKPTSMTAGQKKLLNSDKSGMKSISSFFSKPKS